MLLILTMLLSGGLGFGMGRNDARKVREFASAVGRWQAHPDFRAVQHEYAVLGSDAMSVRLCGIPAERYVMGFRSLPGLPQSLAVSESSAAHYRAFSRGTLSAYLHLAGEQGVVLAVPMVEDLGRRETMSDADARAFLLGFKLPFAVATDAGAIESVRRLVRDTMPTTRPFAVRGNGLVPALRAQIGRNVEAMSRADQARAMETFDLDIWRVAPELWRAKQVSDVLGGIWAQGYGQVYETAIGWFLLAQRIARAVCILAAAAGVSWLVVHRRRHPRHCNAGAQAGGATVRSITTSVSSSSSKG